MKTLKAQGRYLPIYTVNDWGRTGGFVGTNYKMSAGGTHSI